MANTKITEKMEEVRFKQSPYEAESTKGLFNLEILALLGVLKRAHWLTSIYIKP